MLEEEIVPPIQPADFIDPVTSTQQAAQKTSIEEQQRQNIEVKMGKNKYGQEVMVVIADPIPVVIDLEKDLVTKEKGKKIK
ncbi:hypothetical protein [Enterococcus malodoratus]|uniref:hypothetical protein n=1 Tax=Enterococcus malodoratus TaxID=71451 RepID=UPI0020733073|nr:hypothetical protein [Enterococcus malodoratus]